MADDERVDDRTDHRDGRSTLHPVRKPIIDIAIAVAAAIVVSLGIWLMRPALTSAPENYERVKCASNLHQISQAMRLYALDGDGTYPPDLATLVATTDLVSETLICPNDDTREAPPPYVLGRNLSYHYVGGDMSDDQPSSGTLGFCDPSNHDGDGTNVLYADGSVRFEAPSAYPPEIQQVAPPATGGN